MHVLATAAKNPLLANFYEIDWQVVPNLTMDLVVPLLARVMNVYLAGQVFIVAIFAIISGALMLNRTLIGRSSVLPLFAFPLLYNYVFLVGLMNTFSASASRSGRWPAGSPCASAPGRSDWRCRRLRVGAVLLPSLGARHLRHRRAVVRDLAAAERRREAWPPRIAAFVASGLPSSPPRLCFTPARPPSSCPASIGTSTARSTG